MPGKGYQAVACEKCTRRFKHGEPWRLVVMNNWDEYAMHVECAEVVMEKKAFVEIEETVE